MSMVYCHDCDAHIDTDYNEEHFDDKERCYIHQYKDCVPCEGGGRVRFESMEFVNCPECAGNGCVLKEVA